MITATSPQEFLTTAAKGELCCYKKLRATSDRIFWEDLHSIFYISDGKVTLYIAENQIPYANAALRLLRVPLKIIEVYEHLNFGDICNEWGQFTRVKVWRRPLEELVAYIGAE